jgi:hypothetical protein
VLTTELTVTNTVWHSVWLAWEGMTSSILDLFSFPLGVLGFVAFVLLLGQRNGHGALLAFGVLQHAVGLWQ